MDKIRVLIADDSVVYRSQIRAALTGLEGIEVAGAASNGRIACDMLSQSKIDLLILDVEMPEMDGLQTLKEMNARHLTSTKVIMFSSLTSRGAEITLDALRMGASDFVTKPGATATELVGDSGHSPGDVIRDLLAPKIRALFAVAAPARAKVPAGRYAQILWEVFRPSVVVIGSSTGGPTALEDIFSQLRGPLTCPILVTQHMPPLFTASLAQRIEKVSGIEAREAKNGEALNANSIYFAPGDYHMVVRGSLAAPIISLNQGPQENFVRPAVDVLFRSAADIFRDRCLGIVLTGMGSDGKLGAEEIKRQGGAMIIQNRESCVVFGMPGAVFEVGAFDKICAPSEIVDILKQKVAPTREHARKAVGDL